MGRYFDGNMGEPLVRHGAVPVLDLRRNEYHISRMQLPCGLLPFLIPTFAVGTKKYLPALVMNVPIVSTSGLKSNIVYTYAGYV